MGDPLKVYIAGPMKGKPELNYPAFHRAAAQWRANGWRVENPAENPEGSTEQEYIRLGCKQVLDCDVIAMLPGYEDSVGARLELHIAQQVGLEVWDAELMEPMLVPKIRTYASFPAEAV